MITIFIIACPDGVVLATPMAVMVGTDLGAANGILFKNAAALEDAAKLDVIVFDKTGTLTVGQPEVVDVLAANHVTTNTVLATAAAVEQGADHPLGQAILRRAQGLAVPTPKGIRDRPISPRSPWQNPYAERLIGTLRRECLDHVLIVGERHLRRMLASYSSYYNESRTHLALEKDAPLRRAIQRCGAIITTPILSGLHHRYVRI